MKTSRLIAVVAVFVLAESQAHAQFKRGLTSSTTEINLFPVVAPAVLLPAGSFDVEARNLSSAPERLMSRLRDALAREMAENDKRLEPVEHSGQLHVIATITEWTHERRTGKRYVPEVRQVGIQNVASGEGNTYTEPVIDYGRDKPTVVEKGTATIRIEVRRGDDVIAVESARVSFLSDGLVAEGPPPTAEIEDAIIARAAQKAAGLITPGRQPIAVPLARSKEVDRLNALAANRWWTEWRQALQQRPPHPDPRRDAYRIYNIGVALEAMAYELATVEDTQQMLQEAAGYVEKAVAAKKGEKQFAESLTRISNSNLGYTRLKTMLLSVNSR
ncbi:MAG: hypothetical protein ACKOEC_10140 [Acidimicrobiia bacterium]